MNAKPVIVVFLRHFILHASIACMRHLAEERIVSLPDKSPAGANVVALAGGPGASAPPTFGRTAPAQCGFAALRQSYGIAPEVLHHTGPPHCVAACELDRQFWRRFVWYS